LVAGAVLFSGDLWVQVPIGIRQCLYIGARRRQSSPVQMVNDPPAIYHVGSPLL
jgi:hypothetical protein